MRYAASRLGTKERVGLGVILGAVVVISLINPGILWFTVLLGGVGLFVYLGVGPIYLAIKGREHTAFTSAMLPPVDEGDPRFRPPPTDGDTGVE